MDPVHIFLFHACLYWVTRQDVAQETEELAALASAAHSAHFSVSCATFCPVTQYNSRQGPTNILRPRLLVTVRYTMSCSPLGSRTATTRGIYWARKDARVTDAVAIQGARSRTVVSIASSNSRCRLGAYARSREDVPAQPGATDSCRQLRKCVHSAQRSNNAQHIHILKRF